MKQREFRLPDPESEGASIPTLSLLLSAFSIMASIKLKATELKNHGNELFKARKFTECVTFPVAREFVELIDR